MVLETSIATQSASTNNSAGSDGEDRACVVAALAGEAQAWERIVAEHQNAVFRLGYLITSDVREAEDVAQETFIRAYKHLRSFDIERPLKPWLLGICANQARNRRRSMGRYLSAIRRYISNEPAIYEQRELTEERWRAQELWQAVRQLKAQDQEVIYLRFFMALSVAEAAAALEIAPGTVKSRLNRAITRLRDLLEKDFPQLTPSPHARLNTGRAVEQHHE